jgi:hypothetical protein
VVDEWVCVTTSCVLCEEKVEGRVSYGRPSNMDPRKTGYLPMNKMGRCQCSQNI